ncbi:MAG TPA: AMP-binding protein [Longimicrobium sp.]|jgi:phenylacetate-CoA ligase|uniref:AMP-binding protein n=1 Tax=Longimicrobium sp. TaxID=2029185 RepID=UPI002EDB95E8
MLSRAVWELGFLRAGARRYWSELEGFGAKPPAEARREMGRRLLEQVRYFGTRADALPEWREAARLRDPEALWAVWDSLPILTKHDLQTRFHPREMVPRFGLVGRASSTGGSTGEPTPFFHTPEVLAAMTAARHYTRRQMGWIPGRPLVIVWGSERDIGRTRSNRARVSARMRNEWLVDGYSLDGHTVDRVLGLLRRLGPVALYGFTSMLEFVARETLKRGDLPAPGSVRAAWNGGEMLYDSQSELFCRAFGVPILNFYGGRELSAMAYQRAPGAPLRVVRPWLHVDVVDDLGRPVPPGQAGRLIWTSTLCRGTPFLRYDVGDLGSWSPAGRDESGIRELASLQGRFAGLVRLPGGKTINGLYWNHLFKEFPEVEQFQVAVLGNRGLEFRLRGGPLTAEREDELRARAGNIVGHTPVTLRWMEKIPLSPQGKLMQVVHEAE